MPKEKTLSERAREHADRQSPPPRYEPVQAGIFGLFVTAGVLLLFAAMVRIDIERFAPQFAITVAAGFIAPFWHYKRIERKNFDTYWSILSEWQKQQKADEPPF